MSKRLFLKAILMTMVSLPTVAFADDVELPSANPNGSFIQAGALCDVDTLGVSEGNKVLYAVWKPHTYTCPSGQYLKVAPNFVDCFECTNSEYCPGFSRYTYDGGENGFGRKVCSDGYTADYEMGDCTKRFECSEKNPYKNIEHATAETTYLHPHTYCTSDSIDSPERCSWSCEIKDLACEEGYRAKYNESTQTWICEQNFAECPAGTYLPYGSKVCAQCPENSFCAGGNYPFDIKEERDQGATQCPDGLKAPKGAKSDKDCGRLLRIGGDALYLYPDESGARKEPGKPRFVVQDSNGKLWYANTTPVSEGVQKVSEGADKELHIMVGDTEYTVHTTILDEEGDGTVPSKI